ncbi:uncharacterized protein LOC143034879 [Oratosquilla oratoria]|uniref:uncharacterized protein LOC143034879 n=1 Tax=Oratosquilla oratoria TaxID=337810 RepID=UPI003F774236
MALDNVEHTNRKLSNIMEEVSDWMFSKHLKLNEDKTECLIVGKNNDLRKLNVSMLHINNKRVNVNYNVKDLGVILGCNLKFKEQIQNVVKIGNYHLRNVAILRKYLDSKTVKMLVHNHVISMLDYCSSLYYGILNYLLRKLQLTMNRAARLIKGLTSRERITPALIELHWLPIKVQEGKHTDDTENTNNNGGY